MSHETVEEEILRHRARATIATVIATIATSQLFFWSFAIGTRFGPAPLHFFELLVGALFSLTVGVGLSFPSVRRRLEAGASWCVRFREGRRRCRLAFFDDYLTVDSKVILHSAIETADVDEENDCLEVAYQEPPGNQVTRSFTGPLPSLQRARNLLTSDQGRGLPG